MRLAKNEFTSLGVIISNSYLWLGRVSDEFRQMHDSCL